MKIKIFTKSIIGKVNLINKDFFIVEQNKYNQILMVIADGVGSYKDSNFASKISCEILQEEFLKLDFSEFTEEKIKQWGKFIMKNKIRDKLIKLNSRMATTLTFLILIKKILYIFHVGNTRFYQLKHNNEKLLQITNDHDFRIDKEYFFSFIKEKDFLSNSVSNISDCYVDFYKLTIFPGQYLLTTDGIHDFMKNIEIKNILNNNFPLNEKIELIYENSVFNGSLDDITLILFEIK